MTITISRGIGDPFHPEETYEKLDRIIRELQLIAERLAMIAPESDCPERLARICRELKGIAHQDRLKFR
jgi:hypothetical protein